jgi:acetyltransferase-like isoleucine patch superfamily enzyme
LIASGARVALARACGVEIGDGCAVAAGCDLLPGFDPARRGRISLGPGCVLERGVIVRPYGGEVVIEENVFFGPGTVVYGHGGVRIGRATLISMHCRILSSNHAIPPPGVEIRSQPDIPLPTRIGRDVWLGAGVTVLGGVTIGDGCIVGAGAVVTRDLPAYSLALGVPARVTGSRQPA